MKQFFRNLRLQVRLLLGFFIIAFILLGYGIAQYMYWDSNVKVREQINHLAQNQSLLKDLKYEIRTEMHFMIQLLQSKSDSELKQWWEKHQNEEATINEHLDQAMKNTIVEVDTVEKQNFLIMHREITLIKGIFEEIYTPSLKRIYELKQEVITPVNVGEEIALEIAPSVSINSQDTSQLEKASLDSLINLQYEKIDAYNDKIRTTRSQLEELNRALNKRSNYVFAQIDQIEAINSEILKKLQDKIVKQSILSQRATIISVIIGFVLAILIALLISKSIVDPLNQLYYNLQMLAKGEFPQASTKHTKDELGRMREAVSELVGGLQKTSQFALEIGKGNFESEFEPMSQRDVLGNSLIDMRKSLQQAQIDEEKRKIEDQQRNWATSGLARFAEILGHHSENIQLLSRDVIINLVKYLQINQGGIFILQENDGKEPILKLTAAYAYNREKYLRKSILLGEGLLGAAALEKHTVYMTDIPEEYIEIESGTGSAQPKAVLIVPLTMENETLGVIELASFNEFKQHEIQLVEKIAENVASTLATTKINSQTNLLLQQSKNQAIEMQVQEEKMLQTIEELRSSQDEILEREEKLQANLHELEKTKERLLQKEIEQKSVIKKLDEENKLKIEALKSSELQSTTILNASIDPIIVSDKNGIIEYFNPAAEKMWEYSRDEIIGKNVVLLMTKFDAKQHKGYMHNYMKTGIRKIIGIGRELPMQTKGGDEIFGFLTITEVQVGGKTKFVAFVKDLTETKRIRQERNQAIEAILVKEFELTAELDLLHKVLRDSDIPAPDMKVAEEKLIDWDNSYDIGINIIDQQHKTWVTKINSLYVSIKASESKDAIEKIFDEIIDYTEYHFDFEERYMLDFKCDDLELHKYDHDQFLNKIKQYKEDYLNDIENASYSMLLFLKKWLKVHIVDSDAKFVDCFKKNGIK